MFSEDLRIEFPLLAFAESLSESEGVTLSVANGDVVTLDRALRFVEKCQ